MKYLSVIILLVFATLNVACSGDAQSCEDVRANDPKGQACPDDGCPAIDCECGDGSVTSVSSCFNGVCQGTDACISNCENSGGWVCAESGSNNGGANNGGANNGGTGPVECGSVTCEVGQYCLITGRGDATATIDCTDLPDGCTNCDCASDDAPKHFENTNNCSGVISCSQSNGGITVKCEIPQQTF